MELISVEEQEKSLALNRNLVFPFILAHCIHSGYEHDELGNHTEGGTSALVVTSSNLDLSKFM